MSHAKTEISIWKTSSSFNDPVIIEGPYHILKLTPTNADEMAISDLVYMTANSTTHITYCADNTGVFGIVLDSTYNKSILAENQAAGATLTKALLFDNAKSIEIAIPYSGTLVSVKIPASTALEIDSRMMAGATGQAALGDDTSRNFATSLVYNTSGTGTDYIAVKWGNASLTTKT